MLTALAALVETVATPLAVAVAAVLLEAHTAQERKAALELPTNTPGAAAQVCLLLAQTLRRLVAFLVALGSIRQALRTAARLAVVAAELSRPHLDSLPGLALKWPALTLP